MLLRRLRLDQQCQASRLERVSYSVPWRSLWLCGELSSRLGRCC
ncbi:hypothetical protein HU200_016210 [Digitaria exilis]|uniref:Uncharacterized protein n=1 Tax=Digitaria exilis TaxID=1010633 RepID=A0A835F9C2_9POAL|nr:hypothetical protein HU200_016210 [Digitaria exilis]